MTESSSFTTTCSEDEEGNLAFEIPEELLEAMGWGEGTILDISAVGERIVLREVRPADPEEAGDPPGREPQAEGGDPADET
jgi:bifunctional DNA-binding transcriptional regulator/antitoxin component of YhaV-PrlF toxin-antitoxin module